LRVCGAGVLLALFLVIVAGAPAVAAESRPNVLIILADDLNGRDLGFTGNPDVQTPHIDRLAREGVWLKGMFTASPTCSPARHALYTGLYPIRSGAYPNLTRVDPGTKSLFTYLNAAGYRVGLQAKSHVHPPESFPFELISDDADDIQAFTSYIRRDEKRPWLVVFASNDPHSPWDRGPRDRYDPARLTIPPWLHDNATTREFLADYYAEVSKLDEQVGQLLQALDRSGEREKTLVVFLSEQGSSFPYGGKWSLYDNGIHAAAFARWPGKIQADSATNALMQYVDVTPTILELAGVDPESLDTGVAGGPDGGTGFDGRSFLPVLLGRRDHHRDHVFAQATTVGIKGYKNPYPIRAVRDRRYKLIRNLAPENEFSIDGIHKRRVYESWQRDAENSAALAARVRFLSWRPAEEFYDLEMDPFEMHNLAGNQEYHEKKAGLGAELDRWMEQQGDEGLATEMKSRSRRRRHAPPASEASP